MVFYRFNFSQHGINYKNLLFVFVISKYALQMLLFNELDVMRAFIKKYLKYIVISKLQFALKHYKNQKTLKTLKTL